MNGTSHRWWLVLTAATFGLLLLFTGTRNASAAGIPLQEARGVDVSQAGADDSERPSFYGIVKSMPAGGMTGEWMIGDQTVIADGQTQFQQMAGPLAVDGCAKVKLVAQGSNIAHEIESENMSDCTGDGHDDGSEVYGLVEGMPLSGTVGVWTVSTKEYTVTEQSELKMEYGDFEVGKCVKIHLVLGTTDTVREMETERSYKCSDDDDSDDSISGIGKGEIYGELMSFPDPASGSLAGTWVVGTMTFSATERTEFSTKNGDFAVGGIVKVEFVILQDGTFVAREIKTAMAGHDDDGDGHESDRDEGHAYGMIEQLPEGSLIGTWIVAGVEYSVTERTKLHEEHGTFAISETVKIEFKVDSNGLRVAKEIELKSKSGNENEDAKFVGFIDSMPETGFVGLWVVNGVEFSGTLKSKFEEDHGSFTVGAFVKVEYKSIDGVNIIHEMETEVPPGAGDDDTVGKIESMDDNPTAAAVSANTTWVVDGKSFVVTPSTRVSGGLSTTDTVWVNSYAAADGSQVATRIVGVTLDNSLFLPVMRR